MYNIVTFNHLLETTFTYKTCIKFSFITSSSINFYLYVLLRSISSNKRNDGNNRIEESDVVNKNKVINNKCRNCYVHLNNKRIHALKKNYQTKKMIYFYLIWYIDTYVHHVFCCRVLSWKAISNKGQIEECPGTILPWKYV